MELIQTEVTCEFKHPKTLAIAGMCGASPHVSGSQTLNMGTRLSNSSKMAKMVPDCHARKTDLSICFRQILLDAFSWMQFSTWMG